MMNHNYEHIVCRVEDGYVLPRKLRVMLSCGTIIPQELDQASGCQLALHAGYPLFQEESDSDRGLNGNLSW